MIIRCNNCFGTYDAKFGLCPHCGFVEGSPGEEVYFLPPGAELFGRYIVGGVIGYGGFGIIYKAWDKKLETVVAIKEYFPTRLVKRDYGTKAVVLHSENRKEEYKKGLQRFVSEAQNLARFGNHPNIVNVFEYFKENNTHYIVMEFLDGVNLDEYIERSGGTVDPQTAVEIAMCICYALRDIHASDILHRDISPENILVCRSGTVKVVDLGAARFGKNDTLSEIVVKPGYAPPEQYDNISRQGAETDIYAVGATLYTMLTGVKPEESTNRKTQDNVKVPSELNQNVPEYLDSIVMKAMAVDPQFRFRSVDKMMDAFSSEARYRSVAEEMKLKSIRGYLLTAAVGLAVALTALALMIWVVPDAALLPEETVVMWYVSGSDFSTGIDRVISEFSELHPEVTVVAEGFSADHYEEYLFSVLGTDEAPDIFECSSIPESKLYGYRSGVFKKCRDADSMLITSEIYAAAYPGGGKIPVGCAFPVVYVNSTVVSVSDVERYDFDEISSVCGQSRCVVDTYTSPVYAGIAEGEWETFCENYGGAYRSEFVSGAAPLCLSDTTEYDSFITAMAGRFKPVGVSGEPVYGFFSNEIMVSDRCSGSVFKCASAFISFMLGDQGQETMHIINMDSSVPITAQAYEEYKEVYLELRNILPDMENCVLVQRTEPNMLQEYPQKF